ncbi:MAG TPA: transglycosylase SLT domain-containing protein [Stellaceae bacterium]|nr:transglycosylase SLT domain-containing protein [Stellaceae bacterium]
MTAANNPPPILPRGATSVVVSSIRQAARATNIDFGLLMAQAQQESGFQTDARASGSSATGLFQFIDSTWLGLVQRFGAKYGVGALAQQVATDASGRPSVADPATRRQILDLRKDPRLSSALAAEYARQNKGELEQALGRPAGNADLYMAHFLGAAGATAFLKAVTSAGATTGAALLPEAAAANRGAFYDASGRPLSVAQIYQSFATKINQQAAQLASAGPTPSAALGTGSDVPALIRGLTFDGRQLSSPMAAMLNLFTLATLKLIGTASTPTLLPSDRPSL